MRTGLEVRNTGFLAEHGLGERWLYVRQGREDITVASERMRADDLWIASGFRACAICKISLRSRRGRCIGCTKELQHIKRFICTGWVYLMHSPSLDLIKVGSTRKGAEVRNGELIASRHAGVSDWRVYRTEFVYRHGFLEEAVKKRLRPFVEEVNYTRHGTPTYTRETFRCTKMEASRALGKELGHHWSVFFLP